MINNLKKMVQELCERYPRRLWLIKRARGVFGIRSYSQFGEDLIVENFFNSLGIEKPSYIDIGANDPYIMSNTALFYRKGSKGINIEPNTVLYEYVKRCRRDDINLNIGIGEKADDLDFYIMNRSVMSTFSREQAEKLVDEHGMSIKEIKKVQVKSVMSIVDEYCNGVFPMFLSLDAEGLDYDILKSIDFERTSPMVICVETIEYSDNSTGRKETEISEFLLDHGYRVYADTLINTIFVKN